MSKHIFLLTHYALMSLLISFISVSHVNANNVLPDLKIYNIEKQGDEILVWFHNNGSFDFGKNYRILINVENAKWYSEPLAMLGTNGLQGYSFPIPKSLKRKKVIVSATIDPDDSIREANENNQFQKELLLN